MPTCEISGKQVPETIAIQIEGSIMHVAPEYAHMGEKVFVKTESTTKRFSNRSSSQKNKTSGESAKQLKRHFGKLFMQARQKKGWTQEELGKQLHEKISVVQHIEHENIHPSEVLATKIKHVLHVELYETVEDTDAEYERADVGTKPTLGEMLQEAMNKKK